MITLETLREKKHIIINAVCVIGFLALAGYIGFGKVKAFLDNIAFSNAKIGYQRAIEELYVKVEGANCQPLTVQIGDGKTTTIKKADCK